GAGNAAPGQGHWPQAISLGPDRLLVPHPVLRFMYVDPTDRVTVPRILLGEYQAGLTNLLKRLVQPDDVIVEIGAHYGFQTLCLAMLVEVGAGKVIAYESNPQSLAVLQDNVAMHHLTSKVTTLGPAGGKSFCELLEPHARQANLICLDADGDTPLVLKRCCNDIATRGAKIVLQFHPDKLCGAGHCPAECLDMLTGAGLQLWRVEADGELTSVARDQVLDGAGHNGWTLVAARELE